MLITEPHTGRTHYVKCGTCPACLQEKAFARAERIKNTYTPDGSLVALFTTLTYKNDHVPYFCLHDAYANRFKSDGTHFYYLDKKGTPVPCCYAHVKRDKSVRRLRYSKSRSKVRRVRLDVPEDIMTLPLPVDLMVPYKLDEFSDNSEDDNQIKFLNGTPPSEQRVGVIYYKDVQNFLKNLRIRLKRYYNAQLQYYYCCSEYGSDTQRPHFHLLVFCRIDEVSAFKSAIAEAWSFDDWRRTFRSTEVARDCSSYVSSYVNSAASVPALLQNVTEIKMGHSYSHNFGLGCQAFTLASVLQAVERGDLQYDRTRVKNGALTVERVLLPKYVISKYFPRFKGFGRLTSDEVFDVIIRPRNILKYRSKLDLSYLNGSDSDCKKIITQLAHKIQYVTLRGVSVYDYALAYSRVWSIYYAQNLGKFYDKITDVSLNFYAYDNIKDFYTGFIQSPSLFDAYDSLPKNFQFYFDCNQFPPNVNSTNNMLHWYHIYSKDKHVRNIAINQFNPLSI